MTRFGKEGWIAEALERIAIRKGQVPPGKRHCPECGMIVGIHREPPDYGAIFNKHGKCTQGELVKNADGTFNISITGSVLCPGSGKRAPEPDYEGEKARPWTSHDGSQAISSTRLEVDLHGADERPDPLGPLARGLRVHPDPVPGSRRDSSQAGDAAARREVSGCRRNAGTP